MKINHVGIVVKDIEKYIANSVFKTAGEIIFDKLQHNYLCFLGERETRIELIQPGNEDSTVYNFLQKSGEGLHHLCYEVNNIAEALQLIKNKQMMKVYGPVEAIAFDKRKVVFAINRNQELIEFVEMGG